MNPKMNPKVNPKKSKDMPNYEDGGQKRWIETVVENRLIDVTLE